MKPAPFLQQPVMLPTQPGPSLGLAEHIMHWNHLESSLKSCKTIFPLAKRLESRCVLDLHILKHSTA